MAVEPRDAATVILLRNREGEKNGGIEVLMVLRHPKSDFVPGSYVFPGGGLEEEDLRAGTEALCAGLDRETACRVLDDAASPDRALGVWVTAVRETFEEVGLLMAYRHDGTLLSIESENEVEKFHSYRRRQREGALSFTEMLDREGLTLATDRLFYYSHWITPEPSPVRYDTRFFIAEAPARQRALHDGVELTEHLWVAPAKALDDFRKGTFDMVLPTMVTLEELERFSNTADALRVFRDRQVEAYCIKIEYDEEEGVVVLHAPDGRTFKRKPPSVR